MVLLTPYQLYILKALPNENEPEKEVDLNDFFINFGFRHRKTAEAAFERSLRKIIELDQTTDDQKEYIKEVYLDNEFEEVFNTDKLNKYWSVTERTVEEDHIIKRKQEANVNQLIIPERNPKERRIAANTTRNRIFDLSNSGPSGQSTVAFVNVKNKTKTIETPLPELPVDVKTSIVNNFKKGVNLNIMFNNMTKNVIQNTSNNRVFFKLLAHIVESHQLSPEIFIISKLPEFSEMDISFQFWSRIFHLIFSSSSTLKIKSGEKKLESSSFKIDYKIGCEIKDKFMTLSCVEVGRFVNDVKVRDDHHKLLLEGKIIINNIIKNFQFIDPKCVPIFNLQICGMKGDFIETILGNKKEYIAHRPLDRLRAPLHCNNDKTIDTFLRQLVYYKNHVENLCYDIKQMINENDDKRASFGRTLDANNFKPPNFLDWIDDNVER